MKLRFSSVGLISSRECIGLLRIPSFWSIALVLFLFNFMLSGSWTTPTLLNRLGSRYAIASIVGSVGFIVFVIGIFVGSRAIAKKRTDGSLPFLASLPITRRELVVGIVIGRSVAVFCPVTVGVVAGILFGSLSGGFPSILLVFGVLVLTAVYCLSTVALGATVSVVFRSSGKATASGIGLLMFLLLWESIEFALYSVITGKPASATYPPHSTSLFFFHRIVPNRSFNVLSNVLLNTPNSDNIPLAVVSASAPHTLDNVLIISDTFSKPIPFYLQPWFAGVMLLCWGALLPLASVLVFERGDL